MTTRSFDLLDVLRQAIPAQIVDRAVDAAGRAFGQLDTPRNDQETA